jgi:8-amino-7-oxononanoate synthase
MIASGKRRISSPEAPRPADLWAADELAVLKQSNLLRTLEPLTSPQGPVVRLGTEVLVNFSSNDYLSLTTHPKLVAAAVEALHRYGVGSGASRLVVGDTTLHHELEARVAYFMNAPSAVLFNNGYTANIGVLSSLMSEGDVIFSDQLNHASIVDGCRLSKAKTVLYPHRDVRRLAELLAATPGRRRMVCTESIFSMDGDRAPLAELVELCRRARAALMVDEAHAFGLFGEGAGLCEQLKLAPWVDVRIGTFGKACGVFGAFAAGSALLTRFLVNRARPLVFSTSLPAALCAATAAALGVLESEGTYLREKLSENIERFSLGLRRLGLPASAESPIFPIVIGAAEQALAAGRQLRRRGILAKAIRPPTVPDGTSRIRFAVTAGHFQPQIELALSAIADLHLAHAA